MMYDEKEIMRKIARYAFIRARFRNGSVSLEELEKKFGEITQKEVLRCMQYEQIRQMWMRDITCDGIVYRLKGKFRFMEFDEANKFLNVI